MEKALTREDLLYILQSIFKLSEQEDNAFQMLDDGLYVEDYHTDLEEHTGNDNLHVNETLKQILEGFSITDNNVLLYNDTPISISSKENNGITAEEDGLYATDATEHISDNSIHVTQEDKDNWDNTLQIAKDLTLSEISKLVIYDIEIVNQLPEIEYIPIESDNEDEDTEPETKAVYPSSTTLYLLADDPDCPEECTYTMYMFLEDKWAKLNITNQTLGKFALKTEVEESISNIHNHDNKEILDKFNSDDNGNLTYDGSSIHEIALSEEESNAAQIIDGKLYVENLKDEIKSLQVSAAWSKVNLYENEITDSGKYELKDNINNYNLLLIEYYYRPNDENEEPGCAKTAVLDVDTMNYLYTKSIDYMLEYGYGILTANSKISMNENILWVNYYHNVCIYKITGIRKGDDNE